MSMGLSRLGLGLGAHRYAGGSSVIAPEDFGTLARALDANVLTGIDGSAVTDAPNVSALTSAFVPGYVQATPANQPVLGTANGHRFIARGGADRYLLTASNYEMKGTHTFLVGKVVSTGTSIFACMSGANSKIEASGTTAINTGPRAAGAPSICGNALDRKNLGDLSVLGRWYVVEIYLPDGVAGAYIAVDGVVKITTTNTQTASTPMDTLFSAASGYPGVTPDPAIALKYVYSVGSTPMSAPNRSGALSLVQARADALNGV